MSATLDTPAPSITLDYDKWGHVDRRTLLGAFADGIHVNAVFGPDRPFVAQSIAAHLRGIMPTKGDVIRHAFDYGHKRQIAAYRNGREHLLANYQGYEGTEGLPDLNSDDLPED